mmetsp:Transcript_63816/g.118600  ORF Transcript_63816/g.118600 Transcript_63816/m.118600 type:complete len:431 (-) Transcript_63816:151-1443(-)
MEGCSGGLVSLSCKRPAASGRKKLEPAGGPQSKADYAAELDAQIDSRKDAATAAEESPADQRVLPWHQPDSARRCADRGMGSRHGGPMPPTEKAKYAAELDAQCSARKAKREASASADVKEEEGYFFGKPEQMAKPRRALPPKPPSKESYAQELMSQVAAKQAKPQEAAQQPKYDDVLADAFSADVSVKATGRRCVSQQPCSKATYAQDLREQIAARKATVAGDLDPFGGDAGVGMPSQQQALKRGRRPGAQISQPSKSDYLQALQHQMEDKRGQKAADAHHLQADPESAASDAALQNVKRNQGPRDIPSKAEYAASLRAQIADKDWRSREADCERQKGDSFAIGRSEWEPLGRRHHIQHPSKSQLGAMLREQIAAKEGRQDQGDAVPDLRADRPDLTRPSLHSAGGMSPLARSGAMLTGMPVGMVSAAA